MPEVYLTDTPRIILWDIETTHNLAAVFQLKNDDYIPHQNIVQERYVMSAAWKTLGKRGVSSVCVADDRKRYKANPHDDYYVIKTLHSILSDADVIIAHNGDHFDIKYAEARMLAHRLSPLPPIQSVDTLKVARKRFLFNSNRLDYLGQYLGLGRKKPIPQGLWLKVLAGDAKALRTIVAYNKQDVILLEKVYERLAPYVKLVQSPRVTIHMTCPRCGSSDVQRRGHQVASGGNRYPRFQCNKCGGWFKDGTAIKPSEKRKVIG